ncbi:MAG: 16S rRNA (cytosine(967)-C(5))-methyltransferase RsmB [Pseudomonadota bacterium]|nr:16S rRNA (cytosine(967)-C(5))-methyltransferase RsmB [Pseudomonadota bacterium]
MKADARAEAARVVATVLGGRSLDEALSTMAALNDARDRGFVRVLASAVLRDWRALDALITRMTQRPPAPPVRALLAVGLAQLRALDTPEHAAVSATVNATRALGQPKSRGLVNAVLRRYLRERQALDATLPRVWLPPWLADRIRGDWGEAADAVIAQSRIPGPMTLRVHRRRMTLDDATQALQQAGHAVRPIPGMPDALVLEQPVDISSLPGFEEGWLSVQDASAQRAAELIAPRDGERILDACAAPGGKTAHLLERAAVDVTAIDCVAERLARVEDTLARLGLQATTLAEDATTPNDWWDGRAFDAILIDAPCSGTGVIRRHPDIPWLRRPADIDRLVSLQRKLLDRLWPLLRPGGRLVYATCSVLSAENAGQVQAWLSHTTDARARSLPDWGETAGPGRRIQPGGDFDGFYYSVIEKSD